VSVGPNTGILIYLCCVGTMKISNRTLNILKNFSTINESILIKPGNVINTITKEQNVIGIATVEEDFPVEFAIYNLNSFLIATSYFDEPTLTFGKSSVSIECDNRNIDFRYCDPRMVPDTLKRKLNLPKPSLSFKLPENVLSEALKVSAGLELPELALVGEKSGLSLQLLDVKNSSANRYKVVLDPKSDKEFKYTFKCGNLKLLPGSYSVDICIRDKTAIGQFKHTSELSYYIVVEDVGA
jgi:hypothetical protein